MPDRMFVGLTNSGGWIDRDRRYKIVLGVSQTYVVQLRAPHDGRWKLVRYKGK